MPKKVFLFIKRVVAVLNKHYKSHILMVYFFLCFENIKMTCKKIFHTFIVINLSTST